MSFAQIVVIDCGASRVALGAFVRQKAELIRREHLDETISPVAGEEDWLEATCIALPRAASRFSARGSAILILPSFVTTTRQIRTPPLARAPRRRVVRFELGQQLAFPLEQACWQAIETGRSPAGVDELLVAVRRSTVAALCAAAETAGWVIERVLPAGIALHAAGMMAHAAAERRLWVAHDDHAVTLVQVENTRFALRTVPWLARGGTGGFAPTEVAARLASEITRTTLHFERQQGLGSPERIGIIGEGPGAEEIGVALGRRLHLPVDPLSLPATAGGRNPLLVGGAAIGLGRIATMANLLPRLERVRGGLHRRRRWMLAAAGLALATPLPAVFQWHAAQRRSELGRQRWERKCLGLQPAAIRLAQLRAELSTVAAKIERRERAQEKREVWLRRCGDLQQRFAKIEDVWAETLQPAPTEHGTENWLLTGAMLDRKGPQARPAAERMKALVTELEASPFVSAVTTNRLDAAQPGLLRFELRLTAKGRTEDMER